MKASGSREISCMLPVVAVYLPSNLPEVMFWNFENVTAWLSIVNTARFVPASFNLGGKLHVKKEELAQLQMILTIAAATKELHNQVTLQSLI
ncbi:MAG: hypothetical protein ACK55I_16585, partial [bacterium]